MLLLLDRDESLIASLKHNNIKRKRELNGINTLELETSSKVEEGQRLLFRDKQGLWNEYIIFDHFKTHDTDGVEHTVFGEDSTSELYGHYIDDLKPRDDTASTILERVLHGSRFEVGFVEDFGTQSFNLYHTNGKNALWTILEKYGAEIQVRIEVHGTEVIHRYIDLKHDIGRDGGKRFTYKKDISEIKKTTSTKKIATKLYVYGKGEEIVGEDGQPSGGNGRRIDIADVNDGKKYIEDNDARILYGVGKERNHIEDTVTFDECEDKKELLELGKKALSQRVKPEITYELKVEDISRYDGYIGEGVDLGDTVLVIDKEINTRVQTRVIGITDNPLEEIEDSEIVLGNFIKDLAESQAEFEKLKNQIENRNDQLIEELKNLANGVEGSYLTSIIDRFNEELNATGGWVYAEPGEGLIILNAPKESGKATQAIKLSGGMMGIANSKNADGTFKYQTFGDGNGIIADFITAGVLQGGKVRWNLEDGTLLIGNNSDDYSLYWDGETLNLRNTKIDLRYDENFIELKNNLDNKISKEDVLQDTEIQETLKGEDGKSPQIVNGMWYFDNVNTGVKAEAVDGESPVVHFAYLKKENPQTTSPYFLTGQNGIASYNNANDASLIVSRVKVNEEEYQIKLSHVKAGGSPNRGGFTQEFQAQENHMYLVEFMANLPLNSELQTHSNDLGTGGLMYWLTDNKGKGEFENYAYIVRYGTGAIDTASNVSIKNDTAVFDWYLSYYQSFDITNSFSFEPLENASHMGVYSDYLTSQSDRLDKYKWTEIKGKDAEYYRAYATDISEDAKTIIGFTLDSTNKDSYPWVGVFTPTWRVSKVDIDALRNDPKNYIWTRQNPKTLELEIDSTNQIVDTIKSDFDKSKTDTEKKLVEINARVGGLSTEQQEQLSQLQDTLEAINQLQLVSNASREEIQATNALIDYVNNQISSVEEGLSQGSIDIENLTDMLNNYIENLPNEIQSKLDNDEYLIKLKKSVVIDEKGISISQEGSRYGINIDNEAMRFYNQGNEVAYINSSRLYIDEAEILSSIKIFNLIARKHITENGEKYVYFNWLKE